jgi:uncharacterized protein
MEFLYTAIILGLMGSFHCAGMCGPIALSLPLQGNSILQKISGSLLYNVGKTIMYGIIGLLFGLIGQGFVLIGFQQWISIAMGSLMILSVLLPSLFQKVHVPFASTFSQNVRTRLQAMFIIKSKLSLFLLGIINALLPCGLVYMAIAGSIGTGNAFSGMLFMILFGLGTIPMLLFISVAGNIVSSQIRVAIQKRIPVLVVIIGLFFILRGLTLGIPFISPSTEKMNPQTQMKGSCTSTSEGVSKCCCHGKK